MFLYGQPGRLLQLRFLGQDMSRQVFQLHQVTNLAYVHCDQIREFLKGLSVIFSCKMFDLVTFWAI